MVVTAYLPAVAAVTPLYGNLGDQYGRKIVLQGGVVVLGAHDGCLERGDDEGDGGELVIADPGRELALEPIEYVRHAGGGAPPGRREVNDERPAVGGVELAPDERAPLEPVEDVRERRALVPEPAMEVRDRRGTVPRELSEDVRLGLRDPELAGGRLEMASDEVRRTFQARQNFSHIVLSYLV
jgi:hypothetical protein